MKAANYARMRYNRVLLNPCDGGTSRGTINVYEGDADMSSIPPKICGIYKITNLVNGKVYVGQSRDIASRKSHHKYDMNKGGHNEYLYRAMRKYGFDNFAFDIIEECKAEQLNKLEREYIIRFNSLVPHGYNIESGGDVPLSMSKLSRAKISLALGRPVNQYTSLGIYVQTFENARVAGENIGKSRSAISLCCLGTTKTTGGYQWRFAENGNANISPVDSATSKAFPVSQYTVQGVFITTYPNIPSASDATGLNAGSISNGLSGWCKTAGGFQWRAADGNTSNIPPVVICKPKKRTVSVCQFTVEGDYITTFNSLKEAGEAMGIHYNSISACCKGRVKTAAGFTWRYAEC